MDQANSSGEFCCVCLESKVYFIEMECFHKLCSTCLRELMRGIGLKKCPLCRSVITSHNIPWKALLKTAGLKVVDVIPSLNIPVRGNPPCMGMSSGARRRRNRRDGCK